jgi:hypothetical protein
MDKVMVMGNFDVVSQTGSVTFPTSGAWYDYLNGSTMAATGNAQSFTLAPGEYHVYTRINAALPVALLNFEGRKEGSKNLLHWEVENEKNFSSYELQKSNDGQNFSFLATINATGSKNYSFADDDPFTSSIEYYRLKMVDIDQHVTFSEIVKIERSVNVWLARVTPNPFSGAMKINIESPVSQKIILGITDVTGRQLFKESSEIVAGKNLVILNEAAKLSKGIYLLTILASGEKQSIKVIRSE